VSIIGVLGYMAKKRIIFLSFTLLFMFSAFVYVSAANGTKSISVTYRNIVIKVNNAVKQTTQEPFIYDNYTYVPLRFVSESLGADVQWDHVKRIFVKNNRNA